MFRHFNHVCVSVSIGVIVYARDNCNPQPNTFACLGEACPNLIGLKERIELLTQTCVTLGDRPGISVRCPQAGSR
ncbi:hypothetical protein EN943_21465 [Mesorhizobium sp. M7A.F.Ca.US.006.01.1.1]|nr:hypothetical protein EN943_21465 [Mesorhizobium sp. M7A.F.Ca.US.006.01.1.1]